MPKSTAVWGIDIGQCALKAIRCESFDAESTSLQATAFDYIEYPKILSQADADPAELVREALELFLSRNPVQHDRVAISVSGQSGLARFIKLPPVESKKIPDIVKYEARQQIPFALEDVVWDYQAMAGSTEEEGFALETEVGLFAMKRDQVQRALEPMLEVGIEVDYIQLAPLALFNAIVFDQMQDLPPVEEYDPENPPDSVIVISLGTDNTDLVVTNGYRVWQRNIPLGGNHFTRALSKELRLTFDKAEHLKRNAAEAEDPKAVFQAMRPVFSDMLAEIQRSIGYFASIDRTAKIGRVVVLGNAIKLPGLRRYLSQNLGYEIAPLDSFRGLSGDAVTQAPQFQDNVLSFGVSYGLCVQGLDQAELRTNLLPKELVTERIIREKKPWAVAAAAILLLGLTVNYFGYWWSWNSAHPDRYKSAFDASDSQIRLSGQHVNSYEEANASYAKLDKVGQNLLGNVKGRVRWLTVLRAVEAALPKDEGERPEQISKRRELHIHRLDCEYFEDLDRWYQRVAEKYHSDKIAPGAEAAVDKSPEPGDPKAAAAPAGARKPDGRRPSSRQRSAKKKKLKDGPKGPGWVIELTGYHYYNDESATQGENFVKQTLLKNLEEGTVQLPTKEEPVPIKALRIGFPVLVNDSDRIDDRIEILNPDLSDESGRRPKSTGQFARKYEFAVQFCWQPDPPKKSSRAGSAGSAAGRGRPLAASSGQRTRN